VKETQVKAKLLFTLLALFVLASPMFAQTHAPVADNSHMWIWITAGFAMAIASAVCGLAQAKAIAAACEGIARNPGAARTIQVALFVGLALIESLALYTLVVIFAKVTV
jgi:F-type H+-transporting ATPase subunit c